ncbi:MAG TPA: lipid-A-disaccharide synthase [Pyrinomonadaceae bacterium]|nr:lipid-A-disaccharide synthase [Pyrinomonadaceae bacterium]
MKNSIKIMIVAGEASGDAHAAKLVNALRSGWPAGKIEFFGAAGPKMREASVEAVVEADELAIVGLAEIGRALPMFLRTAADLKRAARERKPDAVILVDFPDFNLKLARSLKKQGFTIVYYISPQLWAWRKYRISTVKKYVDLMITILPFEKAWYERRGFTRVNYVGSPLAREVRAARSKAEFCRDHELDASRPIISLLPGSRQKEIARILPVMLGSAARLASVRPDIQFVVAVSTERNVAHAHRLSSATRSGATNHQEPKIVGNETYDALASSVAAAVASGTATLEAAIIGTPMTIVYKTSALNYALLEPFIEVPHYGLVNLIAERRVATELIQSEFTPTALMNDLTRLLEPETNAEMRRSLAEVAEKLGHGGASKRAAEAILQLIKLA